VPFRGHRRRSLNDAGTQNFAVAVLEVVAFQMPLFRRHVALFVHLLKIKAAYIVRSGFPKSGPAGQALPAGDTGASGSSVQPGQINQAEGDVKIEWLTWSFFRIATPGGKVMLTNPWYSNPDRIISLDDILVPAARQSLTMALSAPRRHPGGGPGRTAKSCGLLGSHPGPGLPPPPHPCFARPGRLSGPEDCRNSSFHKTLECPRAVRGQPD